jgi:hypothetical protein
MAISIDFSVKYAHLINDDIPKTIMHTMDDGSDIPMLSSDIPDEYRKPFIHTEDSFVTKYCRYYGEKSKLKRVRSRNISASKR